MRDDRAQASQRPGRKGGTVKPLRRALFTQLRHKNQINNHDRTKRWHHHAQQAQPCQEISPNARQRQQAADGTENQRPAAHLAVKRWLKPTAPL